MLRTRALALVSFIGFSAALAAFGTQALPTKVPAPKENLGSAAKVALGKQLYFDPRLSKDRSVSCNSCHDVNKGGVDGLQFSKGVGGQLGGRNSPTVLNSAFLSVQFWDGRAATLEEQAKGPLVNPVEMAMPSLDAVVERVKSIPGYAPLFEKTFGKNSITIDNIARAIAAYERTLVTPNSPFDRFIKGDQKALTAEQKQGYQLFQTVGCIACHSGSNFAGPDMPLGTGFYQKFPTIEGTDYDKQYQFSKDLGRHDVTKLDEDKHMFRVPTLRNVALTGPYFHNGAVSSLEDAVKIMAKVQLGRDLSEQDAKALTAFLGSLTGKMAPQTPPTLPN